VEDLLQEVSLEVHREIGKFRGESEREFLAWLRQILASILSNQVRHYFGTLRRDPRRERRFAAELDGSSRAADGGLIAPHSTPSQQASRRERDVLLADALGTLPAAYREVIVLRQLEGLSFPEIAARMGRTEDSVKNLWIRALARLRTALGDLQ
jgi:RNA polymerase sigma-70 factor (ECF subfamily)